jgi:hypothetical protein
VVLVPVAVLVRVVPQVAVLVARPVAAQLLAVALQPVVQQQAVLPLRVVQQPRLVQQQLQPQPRLVWWQLVWLLWLWWLLQRLKRPIPFIKTPPLLPHQELVPHWWSQDVPVLPTAEIYNLSKNAPSGAFFCAFSLVRV